MLHENMKGSLKKSKRLQRSINVMMLIYITNVLGIKVEPDADIFSERTIHRNILKTSWATGQTVNLIVLWKLTWELKVLNKKITLSHKSMVSLSYQYLRKE